MIECYARAAASCLPGFGLGIGLLNASCNAKELEGANVYTVKTVQSATARLNNAELLESLLAQHQVDLRTTFQIRQREYVPILEKGLAYSIGGMCGNFSTIAAAETLVNHRLPRISIFITCGFITLKHGSDFYSKSRALYENKMRFL